MKTLKPVFIISIIIFLFIGAFIFNRYRLQKVPVEVLEYVISNWRPGYHSKAFEFWDKAYKYEPLYRVIDFTIIEKKINGSRAEIVAKITHQTGHKEELGRIYTFYLKRTQQGWRVFNYYEGFKDKEG
ncbi:MAG: hypothetical protein JW867_05710 [Candidatus Omnitrophica bacterium]|nr:hypothetical protein [Candidatus Omnitrophota bacterium]